MYRIPCCLLLLLVSASVYAVEHQIPADADNEFLMLDLESLMTTKVDPYLASVLESHIHRRGERMLSVQRLTRDKEASREATDDALSRYSLAPTEMQSETYTVSGMYALSDRTTFMFMLPVKTLSMDSETAAGETVSHSSSGPGDLTLMSNYVLTDDDTHRWIAQAAISLPLGSIDERGVTPAGSTGRLPYAMQLGSGTVDLRPGIMYQSGSNAWTWGAQASAILRLGRNDNDYRLGNRVDLKAWAAREWTENASSVVKLGYHKTQAVADADPSLDPALTPAADPTLRADSSLDAHFVTELYTAGPDSKALRFSLDIGFPVAERHDEPHLETSWYSTLSVQWTF